MSRLGGLSQLRHVELLERAQALVPPLARPGAYGHGQMMLRLAALSREQLMEVIASGQVPGASRGQPEVAPRIFPGQQGGNLKLPPEPMKGARL